MGAGIQLSSRRIGRSQSPLPAARAAEPPPRRPGGHLASAESARKAILRAQDRERLKLAASAPKAIEEALRAQLERLKRRKRVKAVCPNPYRRARNFLRDPVTRFWLGCNVCCMFFLFVGSFGFMFMLYPVFFRPILKY